MKDISNSTLALLVVMAIVVSVFGTLLSITKLDQVGITGMASETSTQTGTANVSVLSAAYINLTDNIVNLDTVAPEKHNDSDAKDDWFKIRNDGSVNLSIEIYDTSQTGTGWGLKDGTGPFTSNTVGTACLSNTPPTCFQIKCLNSSTSSTNNNQMIRCNNTWYPVPSTTGNDTLFLNDLMNLAGNDTAWFGVNMSIPADETSGEKKTTSVTFLAAQS